MDDSISQGPGRKQMAHSNWAFWGYFIKGIFFKWRQSSGRGTSEGAVFRYGENRASLDLHLKGPRKGGFTEPGRALWMGHMEGAVVHGRHWAEGWGGKTGPHLPLAGASHQPKLARSQSPGIPLRGPCESVAQALSREKRIGKGLVGKLLMCSTVKLCKFYNNW